MSDLDDAEINLTPLIDVVFVILIMFIVIAPLLEMDKVNLAEGAPEQMTSAPTQSPIAIHVHADDAITFNGQRVSLKQLAVQLQAARQVHPGVQPQLFQDQGSHFGAYQAVKNVVAAAGFEELDVILKPEA